MSDTQRPALSGLNAQQMREQYTKETGQEVPAELTSAEKVRDAIEKHRDDNPLAPEAAAPKGPAMVVAVNEAGDEREFTAETWRQMGQYTAPWRLPVAKPSED